MIRQLQPGIIIDNRASIPGDFDTPEQRIGAYQSPRPWESCVTLCQSWSCSPTPIKPLKTLVKMLCSTADGNGNMLLSWGPKWDGAFDPAQLKRLEEMGEWMKKYGQTIYNTKGGPWYPADWGGSTYRDNKAFLHISSSTNTKLLLPPIENKILSAICLTGGKIIFVQNKNGISLDLSKCSIDPNAIIIEFVFQNKITAMVKVKSQLSKFSGAMYGSMIADKGNKEIKGNPVVIDLGKIYSVTGVDIRKGEKETDPTSVYKVEVSVNGRDWVVSGTTRKPFLKWEATVAQFSAGVLLPSVDARFVKISKEAVDIISPLRLQHVYVYGKFIL
ncbi:MAG: alpha-L-fucosidase [Bacteroidetes bacterium]|nr:alpha-L-fucosidase [Bacteroidota bacterium]